ncbi:glycosyltransferase family 2 protein, partial [Bacillus sp. B-TM1]
MMTLVILLLFLLFCVLVFWISITFSIKYVLIFTAFLFVSYFGELNQRVLRKNSKQVSQRK